MRNRIAIVCLMLGMFFNPLGFDVLFKMVLDWTGSYWATTGIFYFVAALFFGLYFYFSRTNPVSAVTGHAKTTATKIKTRWQQNNSRSRKTR